MVYLTWILGILFMVIALFFGVILIYASTAYDQLSTGMFGNNIFSMLIALIFSVVLPFLIGLFFMLLPSYVRKHARAINEATFD